jgi:hypothetical protein
MIYTFRSHKPVRIQTKAHAQEPTPLSITYSISESEKELEKIERRVELEKQIVHEWDIELDKQRQLYYNMNRQDVIRELELFFIMARYTNTVI